MKKGQSFCQWIRMSVSLMLRLLSQKEKYKQFNETVLKKGEISIHQAIKRNNLPLFKKPGRKFTSKLRKTLKTMKQDCNLFSRLYISSQVRTSDMDTFFRHKNVLYPPSLSDNGVLCLSTKKSDQLDCRKLNHFVDFTHKTSKHH